MITDSRAVDNYIISFPFEVQLKLKLIRQTIKENAPRATEGIAYGMPAFKINGKPLIYFGAFEKHIGLYPTPSGIEEFKNEFMEYVHGKGSVQFPLNQPLPIELIIKIVRFRFSELNNK